MMWRGRLVRRPWYMLECTTARCGSWGAHQAHTAGGMWDGVLHNRVPMQRLCSAVCREVGTAYDAAGEVAVLRWQRPTGKFAVG